MFSVIYSTYPQESEAKESARRLVAQKLAACVNIIPQITSVYEWEGETHEDSEVLLLAKTTTEAAEAAILLLKQHHSYVTPCITQIPLTGGDEKYLTWIKNTVFTKKSD